MEREQPTIEKSRRNLPKIQVLQEESSQATNPSPEPETLLTLTQIWDKYGLDDYWVYSLAKKGQIRSYRLLGKSRPYYSEPDVKGVVEAMGRLGRTIDRSCEFALAA